MKTIDYSWQKIEVYSELINTMSFGSDAKLLGTSPSDIDIEADDIDVSDTVTVVWSIAD